MITLRCPYCRTPRVVESVVLARTRRNRGVITLGYVQAGNSITLATTHYTHLMAAQAAVPAALNVRGGA